MSIDPWFVDLNGSVNLETELVKRETFYKKILAIGQAIQSGLQNAAQSQSAVKVFQSSLLQVAPSGPTTSSVQPSTVPAVAQSVAATVRKDVIATNNNIHETRRRIEGTLRAEAVHQWAWNYKKHPEDIQGSGPELDIDDILTRVHLLVPPVSGLFAQKSPASESFDENDYYSSQVNSLVSSPPRQGDAATQVAATTMSDGEVPEEEFEPDLNPVIPAGLLPAFQDAEDAAYEPILMEQDQVEDDYEPPAIDSPPYEPVAIQRPPQQLMNAIAGPPLAPRAISINHIRSPIAPQPSHISPLTTATFAQHLDRSAEQSSKSDHEVVQVSRRKSKRKNDKAAGTSPKPITKKQKIAAKKRKRAEETELRPNKRRSQGDGMAFIKQEPISPPPLTQDSRLLHENGTNGNGGSGSAPVPTSRAQPSFSVPAGYKLVPIADDGPGSRISRNQESQAPAQRQHGRPILRDDRGVEYYAYAEPQAPPSFPMHRARVVSEGYHQYQLPQTQSIHNDVYQNSSAYPSATNHHPPTFQERFAIEYYPEEARRAPQSQSTAGFHAEPQLPGRYTQQPAIPDTVRGPQGYPPSQHSHGSAYGPEGSLHAGYHSQHSMGSGNFESVRAHSVHPQAYMTANHAGGAGQLSQAPVSLQNRSSSVYPPSGHPIQMSPYPVRYGEDYAGHVPGRY